VIPANPIPRLGILAVMYVNITIVPRVTSDGIQFPSSRAIGVTPEGHSWRSLAGRSYAFSIVKLGAKATMNPSSRYSMYM
jgi:hypothetical protein